ncbi:hypothetical protein [Thiopseudomonas denitrificans]|uniref:hypothetical protein n=1 Tax=Thiopseudomonas denitrificans TaxID=1501432 RepID=UPI00105DD44A|nr:hypothetical protein [Thiopseudomonas denitrificans]
MQTGIHFKIMMCSRLALLLFRQQELPGAKAGDLYTQPDRSRKMILPAHGHEFISCWQISRRTSPSIMGISDGNLPACQPLLTAISVPALA